MTRCKTIKWNDSDIVQKYLSSLRDGSGVGIDYTRCSVDEFLLTKDKLDKAKEALK